MAVSSKGKFFVAACGLLVSGLAVGQPAAVPPRWPPVKPEQARLALTIDCRDGPGFALAGGAGSLAVGCERGTVQFWDADVVAGVRGGSRTVGILRGHDGPVVALAWAGGTVLASAGADQCVRLWSMPSGKALHTLATKGICRGLALSPDATVLAVGTEDTGIQLYDARAGRLEKTLPGVGDWVTALAFAPDGKTLASGNFSGTACLWDVTAGRLLYCVPANGKAPATGIALPPNEVLSVAFSPDGKQIAVGGTDATVHLLSAPDGKVIRSLAGHGAPITSVAFHPGGTLLASGGKDRTVRLWNVAGGQPLKTLEGHTGWVQGVQFIAPGTRLASTAADGTVRVWDLEDQRK